MGDLLAMTPAQFEQAVADLLHDIGYRDVRRVGAAGDLHVDIWARDRQGRRLAVQCKRYVPGQRIGSPEIQTFIGMIYRHHEAERGIYVTTSDFSEPARELAREHEISLVNGDVLTRLITDLQQPQRLQGHGIEVAHADTPTASMPVSLATTEPSANAAFVESDPIKTELTPSGVPPRLLVIGGAIAVLAIAFLVYSSSGQGAQSGGTNPGSQVASAPAALTLPAPGVPKPSATENVVRPAAVVTTVSVPATPTPAPTEPPDPAQTVRNFYADLNAKNFDAAWELLTPNYQATLDFNSWVDGYRATQSVHVTSAEVAAQEGAHATVQTEIAADDNTGAAVRTTAFAGTWGLVLTEGSWKLDNASIQKISERTAQSPQVPALESQRGNLPAAVRRVQQEGYTASDVSTYAPQFELHVLVGTATGSADGYNRRAFFFIGDRYLGTDTSEASASVRLAWRDDTTVALQYTLYRAVDPMCCPTGGAATVRFQWTGGQLQALDPIPATSTTASLSRR